MSKSEFSSDAANSSVETESQDHGMPMTSMPASHLTIALAGNPNSGKTSVFNSLTGGRQKTGNYAGVTVEKKLGRFKTPRGREVNVVDLPGLYSLSAGSPEENIAQEILLGMRDEVRQIDLAVVVVDSTNIERNLYLAAQIKETGVPVLVMLNMIDIARQRGLTIDTRKMSQDLDVPVIETNAISGEGIDKLAPMIDDFHLFHSCERRWKFDHDTEKVIGQAAERVDTAGLSSHCSADWLARRVLFGDADIAVPTEVVEAVEPMVEELEKDTEDLLDEEIINRYNWIRRIYQATVKPTKEKRLTKSEIADKVMLHPIVGPVLFFLIMAVMFQAVYTWSEMPMTMIENLVASISGFVDTAMPAGELKNLVLEGVITGVGNVIIFLPQIVILFFFIALMEDTGYLARAAFLIDRVMHKVGLNGHAFIPLLSSFACAIPGIMSARTIRSEKDRFVVILIAPLMTCAARLPVYTLLIGAFFPSTMILGFLDLRGLIMLALYMSGIFGAMLVAWLLRRFIFKGEPAPLILEMPSYKTPKVINVFRTMWNSSKEFIVRAGTIILLLTIVLWYLISYPAATPPEDGIELTPMQEIKQSYMGQMGQLIEPVIKPLGYDWKIGVGLISAFAAREVIVGTMAIIYSAGSEEETAILTEAIRADTYPETGEPVWTPLVAASMLAFFVFACMCFSTLAVIKKEMNSWKWPVFVFAYTLALAYLSAFLIYQGGLLLGLS